MVDQDYFVSVGNDFSSIVLPGDIEVEAPDPAVPTDIAAFSGIWVGRWRGTRDTVVVVASLGPEAAEVLYAVGAVPDWGIAFPSWRRLPAFHSDGTLTFGVPGNLDHRFSARMSDSGELSLTYDNKLGRHSETSLTRWTEEAPPGQHGTVGAVALDRCRDLAAGTSTAGWGSKPPGRVGDSPIVGAGTYADNETAAISATGHGEYFIRFAVAHDITAMMRYTGASLEEAANKIIKVELFRNGGKGGVIAVDREGNVAMPFNTKYMLRGVVGSDLPLTVEID